MRGALLASVDLRVWTCECGRCATLDKVIELSRDLVLRFTVYLSTKRLVADMRQVRQDVCESRDDPGAICLVELVETAVCAVVACERNRPSDMTARLLVQSAHRSDASPLSSCLASESASRTRARPCLSLLFRLPVLVELFESLRDLRRVSQIFLSMLCAGKSASMRRLCMVDEERETMEASGDLALFLLSVVVSTALIASSSCLLKRDNLSMMANACMAFVARFMWKRMMRGFTLICSSMSTATIISCTSFPFSSLNLSR